jgi:hypothetical protein
VSTATRCTRPLLLVATLWIGVAVAGCEKKCQCLCACERNEYVSFDTDESGCTPGACQARCEQERLRFAGSATCTDRCCTD